MNILTLERVRLPSAVSRTASHWGERDPWHAADLVRRDIVGAGATLPIVWLANGIIAVVVSWNMPVL
jgi:hypothetical protein